MVKQQEKVTFEEFISQVFNSIRPRLLDLIKSELERSLVLLRDNLIGNKKYERGNGQKRWGYRTRKYLRTSLGRLEHVRVPRIRDLLKEVQLFLDKYTHYCKDVVDQLILAQVFNMSGRKVSLLFEQQSKDIITYPTLTRLTARVKKEIEKLKQSPIVDRYDALIVDGIYGSFRGIGKGVILVAFGVKPSGDTYLLDWKHPEVHRILSRYEDNPFHYYSFPQAWRHRLRTINMAEGFFRHLRTFLSRYPGWVNEEQIDQILGLFLKGIKIYRDRYHNKLKTGRHLAYYA